MSWLSSALGLSGEPDQVTAETTSDITPDATPDSTTPLSDEERKNQTRENRIAHMSSRMIPLPSILKKDTTSKDQQHPTPIKRRKTTPNTNNNSSIKQSKIEKQYLFSYLLIMHLLKVKHSDLSKFNSTLKSFPNFTQFLNTSEIESYISIDDDTPMKYDTIEAILIDRFQKHSNMCSFKYLMQSYIRCLEFQKRINDYWDLSIPITDQTLMINSVMDTVTTFTGLSLSTSDLTNDQDFIQSGHEFIHILSSEGRNFPSFFLSKIMSSLDTESMHDILQNAMQIVNQVRMTAVTNVNFRPALNILIKLCCIEQFAVYFVDGWIPNYSDDILHMKSLKVDGVSVVSETALGAFLNLSYESLDINQDIFVKLMNNLDNPQMISNAFKEYRFIVKHIHEHTFVFIYDDNIYGRAVRYKNMMDTFMHELQDKISNVIQSLIHIKHHKEIKTSVIHLLSYYLFINLDRGKMRYDHRLCVSDGFMLNLNYLMLSLSEPIIKRDMKQKIDCNYFLVNADQTFLNWDHATRMSADNNELKEVMDDYHSTHKNTNQSNASHRYLLGNIKDMSFGFTTEIFCLTLESLHLGFCGIVRRLHQLRESVARIERDSVNAPAHAQFLIQRRILLLRQRINGQTAHVLDKRVQYPFV